MIKTLIFIVISTLTLTSCQSTEEPTSDENLDDMTDMQIDMADMSDSGLASGEMSQQDVLSCQLNLSSSETSCPSPTTEGVTCCPIIDGCDCVSKGGSNRGQGCAMICDAGVADEYKIDENGCYYAISATSCLDM